MIAAITGRWAARRNSRKDRRETRSVSNDSFSSLAIPSRSRRRASRTTTLWRQLLVVEMTGSPFARRPRRSPFPYAGEGQGEGWRARPLLPQSGRRECLPPPRPPDPLLLVDGLDLELARLGELRAGAGAGDDEVGLGRDRAGHFGPEPLGDRLGLVASHPLERPGEDDGLAGERMAGGDRLHRLDTDFPDQRVERRLVARLGEEIGDRLGDHRPDALDRRQLLRRVFGPGGGAQRLPVAEMTRQPPRVGLADMANAERIKEAVERDRAARVDGVEQVARR